MALVDYGFERFRMEQSYADGAVVRAVDVVNGTAAAVNAVTDGALEVFLANELAAEAKRMELLQNQEANGENGGMGMGMGPGMGGMGMMGDMDDEARRQREARLEAEDAKKPYNERRNYGRILFGGDDTCEAIFDVDYVFIPDPKLSEPEEITE